MIIVEPHNNHIIEPSVATIGMFDGVHRGHLALLHQVGNIATSKQLKRAIVTFREHPRLVLHPESNIALLNTYEERMQHLEQAGVDYAIVLDFTPGLAELSAQQFIALLHETYRIQALCIGYDHRFGHNRSEGFEQYSKYGTEQGVDIIQAQAFAPAGNFISSSSIRKALACGDVKSANNMLGYNYLLTGKVVGGHRLGRTIGFPTANIEPTDSHKLIPSKGVYAVRATLPDGGTHNGMMNIGTRPTIGNDNSLSIEVHLLDYSGNLYNNLLTIELIDYIREEKTFFSLEDLTTALQHDADVVRKLL